MKNIKIVITITFTLIILLMSSNAGQAQTTFSPTEESLIKYQVPEWFLDAKIGYWVHWGLYSIPAFAGDHAAEWYGRWMYAVDDNSGNNKGPGFEKRGLKTARHHRETYGNPKKFGYKDFIPLFKAEKFNAEEWADLFAAGGAKFFTMMAMHHDNYPLWDSKTTPVNSVTTGPKRDFVAEMEKAIRKRNMYFGVSNHSAWNSSFFAFNHYNNFDAKKSSMYGSPVLDSVEVGKWWNRSTELVSKYKPDLVWFDWCWSEKPFTKQDRMNFCSWYYNQAAEWGRANNISPEVVVTCKTRNELPDGAAVLDLERGGMSSIYPYSWMNDTSLGLKSWSYASDEEYRSSNQVIDMLLDVISKNGVLLLNIGPKADGSIPEVAQNTILEVGGWLSKNGEGVYGTRPWVVYGEGPTQPGEHMDGDFVEYTSEDIRFTRSKDNKTLFVHVLGYSSEVLVKTLKIDNIDLTNIKSITLLEDNTEVDYQVLKDGLKIKMPDYVENKNAAYSFKISFNREIPLLSI